MNLTQTSMSNMVIKGNQGLSQSAETGKALQLNPGDVINGRVLASENGRAAVRLADGSIMTAELQEGVQLKSGEMIRLQVTEQADGKMFMKLSRLSGNEAAQAAALMEAGAEYTSVRQTSGDSRGVQIAELLRQYGVSPSREGVARTVGLMEAYPQLDVRTAAFLAANGKQAEPGISNPRLDALVDVLVEARDAGASADRPISVLLNTLESNPQLLERPSVQLPLGEATFLPQQPETAGRQTAPQIVFVESEVLPQAQGGQPQPAANQPQSAGNLQLNAGDLPQGSNAGSLPQAVQNQPQSDVPLNAQTNAQANVPLNASSITSSQTAPPQSIPQNVQNAVQIIQNIPQPPQIAPTILNSNGSQDVPLAVPPRGAESPGTSPSVPIPDGNQVNSSAIGQENIGFQQAQPETRPIVSNVGQGNGTSVNMQNIPDVSLQENVPQQIPANANQNVQADAFRAAPQTPFGGADTPMSVPQNIQNIPLSVPNPGQNAANPQIVFIPADSLNAQQLQQAPLHITVNFSGNQPLVMQDGLEGRGQLAQNTVMPQEFPAQTQVNSYPSQMSQEPSMNIPTIPQASAQQPQNAQQPRIAQQPQDAQQSPQIAQQPQDARQSPQIAQQPQTILQPQSVQPQIAPQPQRIEQAGSQAAQQPTPLPLQADAQTLQLPLQPSELLPQPSPLPLQTQALPQSDVPNLMPNGQSILENPPPQVAFMPNETAVMAEPAQNGDVSRDASFALPADGASSMESAPVGNRQQGNEAVQPQNQAAAPQVLAEPLPAAREVVAALTRFLAQADPQTARILVAENAMPQAARVLQTAANLPPEQAQSLIETFAREMNLPPRAENSFMRASDALRQVVSRPLPENNTSMRLFADTVSARLTQEAPAAELNRAVTSLITNLSTIRAAAASAPETAYLAAQAEARADAVPSLTQFTYIQIPVTMYERREIADLYVMKRKHEGNSEKDEFTIAIALETENLGRVEAIVRARDRDVGITFRMNEGDAADQVSQGFVDLEEAVRDAGYNLRTAIMSRLDRPLTPQTFAQNAAEDESRHYALNLLV